MDANKPTKNDAEILRRINRFTSDADWSNDELRAELVNEGVDPDKLISNVKNTISMFLSPSPEAVDSTETVEAEQANRKRFSFDGILAKAKTLGISNFQLADKTELSVVLIAQFDRGLIKVNDKLPLEIVKRIADAINETTEQLLDYLQPGPRFAKDANFKAPDSPTLTEAQDFTDAVRDDPTLAPELREKLLAMSKGA